MPYCVNTLGRQIVCSDLKMENEPYTLDKHKTKFAHEK